MSVFEKVASGWGQMTEKVGQVADRFNDWADARASAKPEAVAFQAAADKANVDAKAWVEANEARIARGNIENARQTAQLKARQQAARDAHEARQADAVAKALINNGVQNLGNGTVDVRGASWGTGSAEAATAGMAPESGQGSGGIVNRAGQDVDVSGQAFGWGSSINTWGQEAESPKAEADWGGWDSSSLDESALTYDRGDEVSL